MKKIIFLVSFFIIVSCKTNNNHQFENLMTEDEMVNFLLDVNIINSSRAFRNISKVNYYNIKDSLLFKKHKIDSIIFSQSNSYYSSNPKLYINIYSKLEKKLKKIKDSISSSSDVKI